jgi:hypothetical protein
MNKHGVHEHVQNLDERIAEMGHMHGTHGTAHSEHDHVKAVMERSKPHPREDLAHELRDYHSINHDFK